MGEQTDTIVEKLKRQIRQTYRFIVEISRE